MKLFQLKYKVIFIFLLIAFVKVKAQNENIKDTTLMKGDTVILHVKEFRGNIEWEKSFENNDWNEIKNEKDDTLMIIVDTSAYYHAKIVEGTCEPIYSESMLVSKYQDVENCIGEIDSTGGIITIDDSTSNLYGTEIIVPNDAIQNQESFCLKVPGLKYFIEGDSKLNIANLAAGLGEFETPIILGFPIDTTEVSPENSAVYFFNPMSSAMDKLEIKDYNPENQKLYVYLDNLSQETKSEGEGLFVSKEEDLTMKTDLVKVDIEGENRIAAYANIRTPFSEIPTRTVYQFNGYTNGLSVLNSNYVPGVTAFFTARLYKTGQDTPIGTKKMSAVINHSNGDAELGTVQIYEGELRNSNSFVFSKRWLSKNEIGNNWMSGFPLLFIFKDYENVNSGNYYAEIEWYLGKRNTDRMFTNKYILGSSENSKSISEMELDDKDSYNQNGILDTQEGITPPEAPTLISPENSANNTPINPILTWVCSDLDGDDLEYDIYLGTSPNPQLFKSGINSSSIYISDHLNKNTTYYWKVKAKDQYHEVSSEMKQFTTSDYLETNCTYQASNLTSSFNSSDNPLKMNFTWDCAPAYNQGYIFAFTASDPSKIENTNNILPYIVYNNELILAEFDANKKYYWRVGIPSDNGEIICWSDIKNFTTPKIKPKVYTHSMVSALGSNEVYVSGEIISNGGGTVSEKGFCYSTNPNPNISDNKIIDGDLYAGLKNLTPNTKYYFKAYAINEIGTSYGAEGSFTTKKTEKSIPTVKTNNVNDITAHQSMTGGIVTDDGNADITEKGICWNQTGNPTTNDNVIIHDEEATTFHIKLQNLSSNTNYYVRAYAVNEEGTGYGEIVQFTTLEEASLPSVETGKIVSIHTNSATLTGTVTENNNAPVTSYGFCWSTDPTPTIHDNMKTTGSGAGYYKSDILGLEYNTTYYVRAFAKNSAGRAYGAEQEFVTASIYASFSADRTTISLNNTINFTDESKGNPTTWDWDFGDGSTSNQQNPSHTYSSSGTYTVKLTVSTESSSDTEIKTDYITVTSEGNETGSFTDSRDGQTYDWVKIGDQVWMAENLNYDQNSYGNDWCYDNNSSNCDTYGRLYDWAAVMQDSSSSNSNPSGVQGVCPDGWHVTSDEEWKELEMELGMSQSEADNDGWRGTNEGGKLAGNASLWNSGDLTYNGQFGASGFTALPGGARYGPGSFSHIGSYGHWWSSTEYSSRSAWNRALHYNGTYVRRNKNYGVKDYGFSVRCVRDE